MRDDEEKTHRGVPWRWLPLVAAAPEMWFAAVITLLIVGIFELAQERAGAVFYLVLMFILMMGSVLAVYLVGKSLKRGKATFDRSEKTRR